MNQQQIRISPKDLQSYKCENCEGEVFKDVYFIKKVSALLSSTGKEMLYPIQVYACVKCNNVNEHFVSMVTDIPDEEDEAPKSNIIL